MASIACVGDEYDWIPPKDKKAKVLSLVPAQIGLIRAWIEQGARSKSPHASRLTSTPLTLMQARPVASTAH